MGVQADFGFFLKEKLLDLGIENFSQGMEAVWATGAVTSRSQQAPTVRKRQERDLRVGIVLLPGSLCFFSILLSSPFL